MTTKIAIIAIMIVTATVVFSNVALADRASEQQILAERISSRIKEALEGEPYTVEQTCDANDCTVSIHQ